MGKSHLEVPYSSDYEVGWANYSYKSRIQATMRWDGQTTLRNLVFKLLWGGMGKPHLEVSFSSDYEVGWANDS